VESYKVLITPTLAPQYPDGASEDPQFLEALDLGSIGAEELIVKSQATIPLTKRPEGWA
jgi:hypothetical protein